ncbi:unnamed protein product [Pleuronectes platessa]|uniref:Uncharacterized protein n=1 Tax=Pleuronectes platessa TaxID=8262 RepID=A0A9N7Z7T9_PLEPL|nr:unnamed protein product [Pleuronectes platessa]
MGQVGQVFFHWTGTEHELLAPSPPRFTQTSWKSQHHSRRSHSFTFVSSYQTSRLLNRAPSLQSRKVCECCKGASGGKSQRLESSTPSHLWRSRLKQLHIESQVKKLDIMSLSRSEVMKRSSSGRDEEEQLRT